MNHTFYRLHFLTFFKKAMFLAPPSLTLSRYFTGIGLRLIDSGWGKWVGECMGVQNQE